MVILHNFMNHARYRGRPGAPGFGFSAREAGAIGMSPRGAVELVIAGIALKAGLFQQASPESAIVSNLFSAIVIMAIVTTIISPILLKRAFNRVDIARRI